MTKQVQVGLWFSYENIDFPYINTFRQSSTLWAASGASEDIYALIAENGYPTRMATGAANWTNTVYGYLLDQYSGHTEKWILTWDGAATVSFSMGTANISTSGGTNLGNRREYTFTSSGLPLNATFAGTITATGVSASNLSNIRFFRESRETALNAGERFEPNFVALYGQFGRLRFMDYQETNGNTQALWSHRTQESDLSWVGTKVATSDYCGVCTNSGNDYTAPNEPSGTPLSWTQGQRIQCKTSANFTFATVTGFTNASPPVVTAAAHGFSNGDTIFFTSGDGGSVDQHTNGATFTVANATTDTFELSGQSAFGAWISSPSRVAKIIRFKTGNLPFKRIVSPTLGSATFSQINGTNGQLYNMVYDSDVDALLFSTVTTGTRKGAPLEVLVALANELNISPWFCIPHMADDDYVTQFATYIRDNLNSSLKVCVELSNEVWNTATNFSQTPFASKKASLKWSLTNGYDQWYGWRFAQVMTLIETVFAGQTSRLEKVFAFQTGAGQSLAGAVNRLEAPATSSPTLPASHATSLAIAAYGESNRSNTSNAQQIWNHNQGGLQQTALNWIDAYLRDDGAVFDGHISGNTLTIDNLVSGTIVIGHPIYSASLPTLPVSSLRTITAGSGSSWTVSGASLGTIASERMNTSSTNTGANTKFLKDMIFPSWKAVADHYGLKLTQYEGGWGYFDTNAFTAASYNGYTFLAATVTISGCANNGSGKVRVTCATATLVDGQSYNIANIIGTTEANGNHAITIVDGTHFDLLGVPFVNTYVAGGAVVGDRDFFYAGYYASAQYSLLLQDNHRNFIAAGGEFPAQYCLTTNWTTGISQGVGILHPNRFNASAAYPVFDTLKLSNAGSRRLKLV